MTTDTTDTSEWNWDTEATAMSWHERICEKTVIPDRYAEITPLPANTFIARAAATLMVDGLFQVRNIAVILCSYLDD